MQLFLLHKFAILVLQHALYWTYAKMQQNSEI